MKWERGHKSQYVEDVRGQRASGRGAALKVGGGGAALLTVIALIAFVMNWRVGLIVALAVPITYALTLLVNLLAVWLTGGPFLDRKAAEYVFHSLDPLHSGTLFYAALTGVVLSQWASALRAAAA